jgi:S-adenosylmethionine-diacylglycerol 3-amino-3-carboxypropyl transferase
MSTLPVSDSLPYGGRLMFCQSWEDPECDRQAIDPRPGDTIVTITSGGDNTLGWLLHDPARVIAIDLNPSQSLLVSLKIAAFRHLSHGEVLELFGIRSGGRATAIYHSIRGVLDDPTRRYWDGHRDWIRSGLLTCGGFERYFALLRRVLDYVIGRRQIERLFDLSFDQQRDYYHRHWNNRRWRAVLRVGCSRWMLGRRLDPSWFRQGGPGALGRHFTKLAEHVLTELPVRSNYFLSQILLGRYVDETEVPACLLPQHFETIRARLDRVELVTADIADGLAALPSNSIDGFALSNVFEYSPATVFDRARGEMLRVARAGARMSLRNLLASRRLAGSPGFEVDARLGERLRAADRGFIYSHFEAARVRFTPGQDS